MNVIKVRNDFSYLQSEDQDLIDKLYKSLRFRKPGYFHSRLYKQKKWDGFINFFNQNSGKFLTGLLPEVKLALHTWGREYTIDDERTSVKFQTSEVGIDFLKPFPNLKNKPITLEDYQADFINQAIKFQRGIIQSPTSSGKAQPLDSLIATPCGFKRMGEIRLGDHVCMPDGGSAPVTGVFPQGLKNILRIEFSNGDFVECCEDHLWKVNAVYDQWNGKVLSAKQLKDKFKCPNGANRYNIDVSKKVDFDKQAVPLDPYMMGLLLGDGCFRGNGVVSISTIEVDILKWFHKNLTPGYKLRRSRSRKCDYRITCGRRGKGTPKNPYVLSIQSLGLAGRGSGDKFIPECYKINSWDSRFALLCGLMDADGYVSKNGNLSYTTISNQLATDIKWLIQSLGGIAYESQCRKTFRYKGKKKNGKLAYVLHFTLPEGLLPFYIKWKLSRCKLTRIKNKHWTISNITNVGKKECQCIMIDHPNHLYVTNNFIPTHNTYMMIGLMKALPPNCPTLFLVNRKGLVSQNYKEIMGWGFPNVGRWDGDHHDPNLITCATAQSAMKLGNLLSKFRALIVDEVHMMMNPTAMKIYKKLTGCCVRIGFSATPFKYGGTDLVHKYGVKGYFGPVLLTKVTESGKLTTNFLQEERERLSASKCFFYHVDEPQIPHDIYIDAVTNGIAHNWHFHQLIQRLTKKLTGRTLILVERIAHGDVLNNLIPGSLWVQGKDDEETRERVIQQLTEAKGNVVAIATSGIFTAGINVFLHNLINAAGGKAEHDVIQRMGRGLRTSDDKEILHYYDFIFRINQYLEDHSWERIKILKKEKHEINIMEQVNF